jgi:hypothetical protein
MALLKSTRNFNVVVRRFVVGSVREPVRDGPVEQLVIPLVLLRGGNRRVEKQLEVRVHRARYFAPELLGSDWSIASAWSAPRMNNCANAHVSMCLVIAASTFFTDLGSATVFSVAEWKLQSPPVLAYARMEWLQPT